MILKLFKKINYDTQMNTVHKLCHLNDLKKKSYGIQVSALKKIAHVMSFSPNINSSTY